MKINKNKCLKIIEGSNERDFSIILFGFDEEVNISKKKRDYRNKIKNRFSSKNTNEYFKYVSEFISTLIAIKEHKAKSILYKNIDSDGYDGAFIKEINNVPRIFLSETKSSNLKYDNSNSNVMSYKLLEAGKDLKNKFEISSRGEGSSSREVDNHNIVLYAKLYIGKEIGVQDDEKKEAIKKDFNNIRNSICLDNGIMNAMSRKDTTKNSEKKAIKRIFGFFKNALFTRIYINLKKDVEEVGDAILGKMEEFYG